MDALAIAGRADLQLHAITSALQAVERHSSTALATLHGDHQASYRVETLTAIHRAARELSDELAAAIGNDAEPPDDPALSSFELIKARVRHESLMRIGAFHLTRWVANKRLNVCSAQLARLSDDTLSEAEAVRTRLHAAGHRALAVELEAEFQKMMEGAWA